MVFFANSENLSILANQ